MALLMLAFTGIMEEKPKRFLLWTALAGCVHAPALIFLPAYWMAKSRLSIQKMIVYGVCAGFVFFSAIKLLFSLVTSTITKQIS